MRTVPRSRLLLLLFLLLTFISVTCTRAESVFFLKNVTLHVWPADAVERGAELRLICVAKFVHSGTSLPFLKFSFFKDYNKHNTVHLSQTNTSDQVTHTISRARASHTGTYQCDVTANNQHKESSIKNIVVKGLQTPVLSVDQLSVIEGDIVRITCSAHEETGELNFVINDGSKEIYNGRATSGAVQWNYPLMSVGTAELSCSYSIDVGRQFLFSNVSNVVSVLVKELDFRASIAVHPSTEVIEGDPVHIVCSVTGVYHNSPSLLLHKGSRFIQTSSAPGQTVEHEAVAQATDSGMYVCSATMNNIDKDDYANLTVKELFSAPVLSITPAEVFERQQFTVTCVSSEVASERIERRDVRYTIYRKKQELSSAGGVYVTTATTETNGEYTCSARVKDTIKQSRSVIFRSKVLVSRPSISVRGEVILGRRFTIECYSDNGSVPIVYTLRRNNAALYHVNVSRPFQKATFNTSIESETEIREFRCEAQNNGADSTQTSDALFAPVTVPVGAPTLLILPVADDVTEDNEVHFLCSVMHGTPPITFKWYQGENRRPLNTTTVKTNRSTFILPSVSSAHGGTYYCEALNGAGNEEVSNHIVITVRMARWKKGLIIGVCLLCVAGFVIAFLIRYRAKRGKRETTVELSVKPAIPKYDDDSVILYP